VAPNAAIPELSEVPLSATTEDCGPANRSELTHALLLQAHGAAPARRQELLDKVVLLNMEVAESIVLRYRNRGVAQEDLVQIAFLGLVKAAQGYDPDKSDSFLGYAVPTIRGEVKRFFRDNAWVVRPPRRIQELQSQITSARADLAQMTGHEPTPEEIAGALDVDVDDVNEAMTADGCYTPSSLDKTTGEDDAPALWGLLGADDRGYDRAEALVVLRPLCRKLSARDRRILYLRFFHEWTQAKIAAEFGVTQMQVSRLLARILKQLRDQLEQPEPGSTHETDATHETDTALAAAS